MKIRLLVSYEGTNYCGWQMQARQDLPSVQATLEKALSQLFRQEITVFASGRTDAGVHAIGQVCHFRVDGVPEERFKTWDLCWALRGILPTSISVRKAWLAPEDFHATLSASHKIYRYYIYNHPRSNPFMERTAHWMRWKLDIDFLNECSRYVVGHHDFKAFQSAGTKVITTDREIFEARWENRGRNMLQFTVDGEGFLKQMVRNIVGTQLWLHKEKRNPSEMRDILLSLDRKRVAAPAPARGLFLWKVFYPRDLDNQCRPL